MDTKRVECGLLFGPLDVLRGAGRIWIYTFFPPAIEVSMLLGATQAMLVVF